MSDKISAQNFINRGIKNDNKVIYSLIFINIVFALLAAFLQVINDNQIMLRIIISIFVVYILYDGYSLIFQIKSIKRNNLLCAISIFFSIVLMNFLYYTVLQPSNALVAISIVIQIIISLSYIKVMSAIAINKKGKVYQSKKYEYNFTLGLISLIITRYLNIPEEYEVFVLTIIIYSVYVTYYYYLVNYIFKLRFAVKYDINTYTN